MGTITEEGFWWNYAKPDGKTIRILRNDFSQEEASQIGEQLDPRRTYGYDLVMLDGKTFYVFREAGTGSVSLPFSLEKKKIRTGDESLLQELCQLNNLHSKPLNLRPC